MYEDRYPDKIMKMPKKPKYEYVCAHYILDILICRRMLIIVVRSNIPIECRRK